MREYIQRLNGRIAASPLVLLIVGLFVVIASTTAVALTVTQQTQQMSVFTADTTPADITVTDIEQTPRGPNQVHVAADLQNTVNATTQANITVELLDANGNVIKEKTTTVELQAGETRTERWQFKEQGLVEAYDEVYIVVDQS